MIYRLLLPLFFMAVLPLTSAAVDPDTIRNTKPAEPPRTVELEEIWRVGGEEDDHVFGLMIDARCDTKGNVYLLDQQLSRVTMVSPAGEYVAELGGEGDGPGECRMPQTLTMMPDGTVGLGQRLPGKFIKVTKANEPAGNVAIGGDEAAQTGFTMLVSGRHRGGTLLVGTLHQVPGDNGQTRNSHLQRLSATGEVLADFAEHATVLDFTRAHFSERAMVAPFIAAHTVGPDGRVYLASTWDQYLIEVHDPQGNVIRTVTRDFVNPKRDQQTLDRINALFEEQDRALPFRITWDVEPCDQTVGELVVTPEGDLLVAHSRSGRDLPEGVFLSYDAFDPDGRWRHELHVHCEADRDHDGLIFLDDGRVLLVKGLQLARLTASGNGGTVGEEEDGATAIEVICCRLVPAG
jgi:hypothetical protein